ncbi:hypothetical protein D3C80_1370410 [compost metagenome]
MAGFAEPWGAAGSARHEPVFQGARRRTGLPAGLARTEPGRRRSAGGRQRGAYQSLQRPHPAEPGSRCGGRYSARGAGGNRPSAYRWRSRQQRRRRIEDPPGFADRGEAELRRLAGRGCPEGAAAAGYSAGQGASEERQGDRGLRQRWRAPQDSPAGTGDDPAQG